MSSLLVLADDYTGALDTGVQFSRKGVSALVLTRDQVSFERASAIGAPVLVIDMESRHISPADAYRLVLDITSEAIRHGARYFYKKTDSALRGNIGAELAGLLDAGGDLCLSFIPAFPKSGRVTVGGVQYIDGIEVAESVFAKDPLEPVTLSSVADIVRMQSDVPIENITRAEYAVAAEKPSRKTLRILDAESAGDIEELGAHLKRGGNLRLTAGCAGFAEILPELLEFPRGKIEMKKNAGNVLIVSGSVNPITMDQLSRGADLGFAAFTLSPSQKLDVSYLKSDECGVFVRNVVKELELRGRVIVRAAGGPGDVAAAGSFGSEMEVSQQVANNIGELTLRILEEGSVGNLAVFGGDTLHSVLNRMRCEGVLPVSEIAPGIVAAHIISPDHDCVMITKSGGLGGGDVLSSIDGFVWG
jgi:uncharacterized protein YgbK (DUF1537 family)